MVFLQMVTGCAIVNREWKHDDSKRWKEDQTMDGGVSNSLSLKSFFLLRFYVYVQPIRW